MTAVEYLFETLFDCPKDKLTWYSILEKAKEMEKQQIIDAMNEAIDITKDNVELSAWGELGGYNMDKIKVDIEQYYNETYGSKGSDEHIVDTNEMVDQVPDVRKMVSYTKQDVIDAINRMYDIFMDDTLEAKKLRLKGVSWHIQNILESIKEKLAKTSSQTEISDEEIEKELIDLLYDFEYEEIKNSALYKFDYEGCAKALTKWYREQLKNK